MIHPPNGLSKIVPLAGDTILGDTTAGAKKGKKQALDKARTKTTTLA